MFSKLIISGVDTYFNGALRSALNIDERYTVDAPYSNENIFIRTGESSSDLIRMMRNNDTLQDSLEKAILNGFSSSSTQFNVGAIKLDILDDRTLLLHIGKDMHFDQEKDAEVLKYYIDTGNLEEFIRTLINLDKSNKEKLEILARMLLGKFPVEKILVALTREGVISLADEPNFSQVLLDGAIDEIDRQNSAFYLYVRLRDFDNLPDDLDIPHRGINNILVNSIKNLIDFGNVTTREEKIIRLLRKYNRYFYQSENINEMLNELYQYTINSRNVTTLLRVIAALANTKSIVTLYNVEDIRDTYT